MKMVWAQVHITPLTITNLSNLTRGHVVEERNAGAGGVLFEGVGGARGGLTYSGGRGAYFAGETSHARCHAKGNDILRVHIGKALVRDHGGGLEPKVCVPLKGRWDMLRAEQQVRVWLRATSHQGLWYVGYAASGARSSSGVDLPLSLQPRQPHDLCFLSSQCVLIAIGIVRGP